MKYLIFILLMATFSVASADVDLIVQSHEYWKDGKPTNDWTKQDFKDFWQQTHKGEIIDILPVSESHGREVKPPSFVIITVTGVTIEQVRQYLQPLDTVVVDGPDVDPTVKERRWHFRRVVIDSALALYEADGSRLVLTKAQASTLIKEYDLAVIKQKIKDRLKR